MARVDVLSRSSLWAEEAVAEDVGMGGVCGFQGLSLSEAAVAGEKEEVDVAPATSEAGCFKPVAVAGVAVEEAPAEKKRQVELTPYEIQWLLARKPCPISPSEDKEALLKVYPSEMVDGIVESRRVVAEAMAFANDVLFELQESVRKDLAGSGVVMVDDLSSEGESEEAFHRMNNYSEFGNYSDMYGTDDEEEEEVSLEA